MVANESESEDDDDDGDVPVPKSTMGERHKDQSARETYVVPSQVEHTLKCSDSYNGRRTPTRLTNPGSNNPYV